MKSHRCTLVLAAATMALAVPGLARADSTLSLKRVMLSTAGVGYYEYEADVDGPTELGLDVNLDQVDDVLTSLVVFDTAGGVGSIELPGRDSTHAAFGAVPFGPEALQSPLAYVRGLQGVDIEVTGPRPMKGRILTAEPVTERSVTTPDATVTRTRVTLMGDQGLQQFILEDETSIQVSDPKLRDAINQSLEAVRRDAAHNTRHLTLRVSGQGHRTVRVGFVVAAPLWKASYRLVMPAPMETKARLQGWAVLENTTGNDWKGVDLSLQYGNPVTFHQAIYQTYFVQRPEVPVEILSRLLPDVDTRATAPAEPLDASAPPPAPVMAPAPVVDMAKANGAAEARMAGPAEDAEAREGTEETIFHLALPVSLDAGHTASVPILDREIPSSRVDVAPSGQAHPYSAIRIVNDSATSLPAGVLALYDPSGAAFFAGDARLGGLPIGETRLLQYAEDLRTTVTQTTDNERQLVSLTASQGIVHTKVLDRLALHITVQAPAQEARQVLLGIDKQDERRLTVEGGPVPGMTETATAWRLPVTLKAGEVRRITVYLDMTNEDELDLTDTLANGNDDFGGLFQMDGVSPAATNAIHHLVVLNQAVSARRSDQAQLSSQQQGLDQDEARIRSNLVVVPAGDALHTKLIDELGDTENQIGALRQKIDIAKQATVQAQQALADAISNLTL
jgi:hypothetical protein